MKNIGLALMLVSALIGVIQYRNIEILIGSIVFFVIGYLVFKG